MLKTPVLIVGAGPVGLNLAIELAQNRVPVILVNEEQTTRTHAAGSGHSAHTMEHYRRLGISDLVRRQGMPDGHSTDVVFVTRVTGFELSRIELPPVHRHPVPNTPETAVSPEPLHRANQIYVERALKGHLDTLADATVMFGWRLTSFEQHDDHVTAEIEEVATGRTETVECGHLVGCDGGQSIVRRALGIGYEGKGGDADVDFMMGRMLAIHYRAPELLNLINGAEPWQFQSMNPDGRASIITLDGKGEYLTHAKIRADQDPKQIDPRPFIRNIVGRDIGIEILTAVPWTAGLSLVAERYQDRRVLLAGDAVHLFTPTGGFGMNTGVEDAANLAWKLAAVHHGWAGPNLIATYETERRPIAQRNLAQSFAFATTKSHLAVPEDIEADTPDGAEVRAALGKEMATILREEFLSIGIQLGARYDASPIVVPDGTTPPADAPFVYEPSACPGGRAPHAWLPDGRALFDLFGDGFTLLGLGGGSGHPLQGAARQRDIPLERVDLESDEIRDLYGADWVLVRPDGHVAWRGNESPEDAEGIWDAVTGVN